MNPFHVLSANVSKGEETVAENKNAAANTKEVPVDEIAAKEVLVDEIAAMDEAAAVNESDAVDKAAAAAEDAIAACHGMAPAVAHCGKL